MKIEKLKNNKKKAVLIGFVFLLLILILSCYFYYTKLRVVLKAVKLYKEDCHMMVEYHLDYNTEDEDEEEGFIKSLGAGTTGFIVFDKSKKAIQGTCYSQESELPYFSFYRDDDDTYFNIKTIFLFVVSILDKEKESKIFSNVASMDDLYLTSNQIKNLFDIEINKVDIDWEVIIKKAKTFKKCSAPEDVHTSVDVNLMDFYEIELGENEQLIFGIEKGIFNKSNVIYISAKKNTMRLEIYGAFKVKDNIDIDVPPKSVDDDKIEDIKKKYKFVKYLLELLTKK